MECRSFNEVLTIRTLTGLLLCVLQSILRVQTLFLFIFFGAVMIILREVILLAVVEAQVSALLCSTSHTAVVNNVPYKRRENRCLL